MIPLPLILAAVFLAAPILAWAYLCTRSTKRPDDHDDSID